MPIFTYFQTEERIDYKKIEEWASINIGIRSAAIDCWNYIGLPDAGGCIGLRFPDKDTYLAFKLSFPYKMGWEFEALGEFTYLAVAEARAKHRK